MEKEINLKIDEKGETSLKISPGWSELDLTAALLAINVSVANEIGGTKEDAMVFLLTLFQHTLKAIYDPEFSEIIKRKEN